MGPLQALESLIIGKGLAVKDTTLFLGTDTDIPQMTTTGPAVLSIAAGPGSRRTRIQGRPPSESLHYPHFQIVSRHPRYPIAEALIRMVYEAIELENTTIGDVFFLWVVPMQEPFDHGKDSNGRPRLAFNVETCWRR